LEERAEATLSNVVTASRTHATISGISLLVFLTRPPTNWLGGVYTQSVQDSRTEQDDFAAAAPSPALSSSATNTGFSPALRAVEEMKPANLQKKASTTSVDHLLLMDPVLRFCGVLRMRPLSSATRASAEDPKRLESEPSSSDTTSPPPIFG
jgi:protein SPA2